MARFASLFLPALILFLVAGCTAPEQGPATAAQEGPAAEVVLPAGTAVEISDNLGQATFSIAGRSTTFSFIDEGGAPLKGLSIGLAMDPNSSAGVLMVIDPYNQLPLQVISIQGEINPQANFADVSSAENVVEILLPSGGSSALRRVVLKWLPNAVSSALDLKELTGLAAKALNQSGVPVGEYAGRLDSAEIKTLSREQAAEEFWKDVKDKVKNRVFFFMDPEFYATGGSLPTIQGVVIDTLSFGFDADAIFSCGLPGEQLEVTSIADLKFYQCKRLEIKEQVKNLVKATGSGTDERGQPLSTGSLEMVSKGNIGLGYWFEFSDGVILNEVPVGNYLRQFHAKGFYSSEAHDFEVPKEEIIETEVIFKANPYPALIPAASIDGTEETYGNEIYFSVGDVPNGSFGKPYSFSFCLPDVDGASDLCTEGAYSLSGGNPPYHFELESGKGFPHQGLILHPNGFLNGTPTSDGKKSFGVCAVDLSGNKSCQPVELSIHKPETWNGTITGTVQVEEGTCPSGAYVTGRFVEYSVNYSFDVKFPRSLTEAFDSGNYFYSTDTEGALNGTQTVSKQFSGGDCTLAPQTFSNLSIAANPDSDYESGQKRLFVSGKNSEYIFKAIVTHPDGDQFPIGENYLIFNLTSISAASISGTLSYPSSSERAKFNLSLSLTKQP